MVVVVTVSFVSLRSFCQISVMIPGRWPDGHCSHPLCPDGLQFDAGDVPVGHSGRRRPRSPHQLAGHGWSQMQSEQPVNQALDLESPRERERWSSVQSLVWLGAKVNDKFIVGVFSVCVIFRSALSKSWGRFVTTCKSAKPSSTWAACRASWPSWTHRSRSSRPWLQRRSPTWPGSAGHAG